MKAAIRGSNRKCSLEPRATITDHTLGTQISALLAILPLAGARFPPPRYRQPVRIAVTVQYVIGLVAFAVYALWS